MTIFKDYLGEKIIDADNIKLAAINKYEEIFLSKKVGILPKLLGYMSKSKQSVFELNKEFVQGLKELIPVFNEQTVAVVLDIVLNDTPINQFEQIKKHWRSSSGNLGNLLLEQVESQNALCLQHITMTEDEKKELWMFVRELFAYPRQVMNQAVAEANLNLYLVQKGFKKNTEDYTSSSMHGYSDFLSYVITDKEVKFIYEPVDGMSSNLKFAISHDDFQTLIMELYRAQSLNYSLSKNVKFKSIRKG